MTEGSEGISPEGHKGGQGSILEDAGPFHRLKLSRGLSGAINLHRTTA